MKLTTWAIEPRDTLVVRDGRPSRRDTPMGCLPFPLPTSVAGLVRSEIGFDEARVFCGDPQSLKEVEVAGPWLVELRDDDIEVFGPAPADARWLMPVSDADAEAAGPHDAGPPPEAVRIRCTARSWGSDIISDLPAGLHPIQPVDGNPLAGKPPQKTPAFWRWRGQYGLARWLFTPPSDREHLPRASLFEGVGPEKLVQEERVHVALDGDRTAVDGALFSTAGLRTTSQRRRFAVGFACGSDDFAAKAGSRPVFLGGERRLSRLRPCNGWPPPTEEQWAALSGARRLRVMLLTPGLFAGGFRPEKERIQALFGDTAKLVAAAVDRPTIVSGYDFERRAEKPVRRAAPAGSVYWIETPEPLGRDALERAWMSSLCDDPQDRLDGFGRILLGVGR